MAVTLHQSCCISHAASVMRYQSRRLIVVAAATMIASWSGATDDRGALLDFSEQERRAILQHGPWPQPWSPDPSNRVSGKPEAIALGERLFFDARLSANGSVSCASCHTPERGWADGRKLATGLAEVDRNTPSVLNIRHNRWFGWDGANDTLWAQNVRPLLDSREMG